MFLQHPGHKETRQHKEDVNPQKSTGRCQQIEVKQQHGTNGEGTQALQIFTKVV
jgi:hypothetical protein